DCNHPPASNPYTQKGYTTSGLEAGPVEVIVRTCRGSSGSTGVEIAHEDPNTTSGPIISLLKIELNPAAPLPTSYGFSQEDPPKIIEIEGNIMEEPGCLSRKGGTSDLRKGDGPDLTDLSSTTQHQGSQLDYLQHPVTLQNLEFKPIGATSPGASGVCTSIGSPQANIFPAPGGG
ncbi:unnamed protein product, partial [Rhizoctonia solani]